MGEKVAALQNKGADILLVTGDKVELKAGTGLNPQYMRAGATTYGTPCIFLGDGRNPERIFQIGRTGVRLLAYEVFSDGLDQWVLGIIEPEE